jgi:ParB-like chromosome segregation protein Spo0J
MSDPASLPIDKIRVGTRHRKDMGDIASLAKSISLVGLLQPIVVRADDTLVSGERRLQAVASLKWDKVPVHIVHNLDEELLRLQAERDENTCRKDFTPEEAVAITRAIEKRLEAEADVRKRSGKSVDGQAGGRAKKKPSVESTEGFSSGDSRDRIADAVGTGWQRLERAGAVVDAAEKEPEKFGPIKEEMNRTGNVNGAFKKVEAARKPPSPPDPTPRYPYSDTMIAWMRLVLGQACVNEVELGGITAMLGEADKWDWTDTRNYLLPQLQELEKRIHGYCVEIEHAVEKHRS